MKKYAIEIKWGIRFFLIQLVWLYSEKMMGYYDEKLAEHAMYSLLFYIPAIFIYYLAIREKKQHYFHNQMDWKQGAISGIFLTTVIALLTPLQQIIFHKGMAPEFLPNMIALAVKNGHKPEAAAIYFSLSSYIFQSIFTVLSFGVVISAIVAYFLRTKPVKI